MPLQLLPCSLNGSRGLPPVRNYNSQFLLPCPRRNFLDTIPPFLPNFPCLRRPLSLLPLPPPLPFVLYLPRCPSLPFLPYLPAFLVGVGVRSGRSPPPSVRPHLSASPEGELPLLACPASHSPPGRGAIKPNCPKYYNFYS